MNRAWSEKNRNMQQLLKRTTFPEGIRELLELRAMLMDTVLGWREMLTEADYSAMPFPKADGYHSKTVAYSLWHIFRIEDIVVNTLIRRREQVLFSGNFAEKIRSPIITTGNELTGEQITEFSRQLEIGALYDYILAVKAETDAWLMQMDSAELKRSFGEADKAAIRALQVVSEDESAAWLVDYWCGKDIRGLIRMPLSRHWIMHIEAAERIIGKIR